MAIRVCWKLHLSLNFLEMSYHSAIVDRIFTKFSVIVLQQPLAIYDTAFNKILYRKFKDWKDLLLNSVELVKISHCIQLDWSQQVFLGDEIRSEIWSSILKSFVLLLKYPLSLLLFTHSLVFPLWDFLSSGSINSCNNTTSVLCQPFWIIEWMDFWSFEL